MSVPVSQDNALTVQAGSTAFISAASNLAVSDTGYPDSAIAPALSLIAPSAISVGWRQHL
jgi:hypothetical protein